MYLFGAAILCTILPSQVAFTSLVSAGAIPTTAAYGLISLLRLTMTPNDFKNSHFYLGKWRRVFYLGAALFNGLIFAVRYFALIDFPLGVLMLISLRLKSLPSSSLSQRNRSTS